MKKILSFVLASIMSISFTLSVSAQELSDIQKNKEEIIITDTQDIIPFYEPHCGSNLNHEMYPVWNGKVYKNSYSNSNFQFSGACYQCVNCYLIMVCEYDPLWYTEIQRYAVASSNSLLPLDKTTVLVVDDNNIFYKSGNKLTGYNFHRSW